MSVLKSGYFKVSASKNEQLQLVQKGPNHETLNSAEQLPTWDEIKTNILSCIRGCNGKSAIVVDATRQNLTQNKLYFKLTLDGRLKQITVGDDVEVPE